MAQKSNNTVRKFKHREKMKSFFSRLIVSAEEKGLTMEDEGYLCGVTLLFKMQVCLICPN